MLACPSCGATYIQRLEHCGLDGHRLEDTDVLPLVGRTVDRYRVEEALGSGGMAVVYRAVHLNLEQPFALKALHGEMASDHLIARRFEREAKVMSQLAHPNIVSVVDFGRTEGGLLYMVMEFVRGPTLGDVMRSSGPLPPTRVARLARQIALGLERAHRSGFVHRDLKPQNVMLLGEDDEEEHAKILDFGLVGLVEPDTAAHTQLTTRGMFFGTPAYMSPEQISGEPVGPPSDLYALGVMMYAMLTGELPFRGDLRELAHQHVTKPAPRPNLDYGGLTDVVMKLLNKEPDARLTRGREVAAAIDATLLAAPPGSMPPAPGFDLSDDVSFGAPEPDRDVLGVEPELVVSDAADLTLTDGPLERLEPPKSRGPTAVLALLVLALGVWAMASVLGGWPAVRAPWPAAPGTPAPDAATEAPTDAGRRAESGASPAGRTTQPAPAEPAPSATKPPPAPEPEPEPEPERSREPAPKADDDEPAKSPSRLNTESTPETTRTPAASPKPERPPRRGAEPAPAPPEATRAPEPPAGAKDLEAEPSPEPVPAPDRGSDAEEGASDAEEAPESESESDPASEPEPEDLERRLEESLRRLETSTTGG